MRFYVCIDKTGAPFDCVRAFAEARTIVAAAGGGNVTGLDVDIRPDSIMRMLGHLGGYAKNVTHHDIKP